MQHLSQPITRLTAGALVPDGTRLRMPCRDSGWLRSRVLRFGMTALAEHRPSSNLELAPVLPTRRPRLEATRWRPRRAPQRGLHCHP